MLWALSKLFQQSASAADPDLVAALQTAARQMVPSLNPQDVAQILHAVATLCSGDRGGRDDVLESVNDDGVVVSDADSVEGETHNNAEGPLASSGGSHCGHIAPLSADSELVSQLVERAVALRGVFKPQELSSVVASAVQLDAPPDALASLLARAAELAPRFDPASLASLAMATARHKVKCPEVLVAVGDAAAKGLGGSHIILCLAICVCDV